jgi:hypothetical protein
MAKEKVVYDPKEHAKDGADVEPDEAVTQFEAKANKYAFIHIPKRAIPSLPFKLEKPLIARIDGDNLIVVAATAFTPFSADYA